MKNVFNKRGDGHIATCILVVILCMFVAVFMTFTTSVGIIKQVERDTKIVLDNFIMKNSIMVYDSIKNGNDYTLEFNEGLYIDDLCEYCTFEKNGNFLYAYDSERNLKFKISSPEISFSTGNTLKINANYTVYMPIALNGF